MMIPYTSIVFYNAIVHCDTINYCNTIMLIVSRGACIWVVGLTCRCLAFYMASKVMNLLVVGWKLWVCVIFLVYIILWGGVEGLDTRT